MLKSATGNASNSRNIEEALQAFMKERQRLQVGFSTVAKKQIVVKKWCFIFTSANV